MDSLYKLIIINLRENFATFARMSVSQIHIYLINYWIGYTLFCFTLTISQRNVSLLNVFRLKKSFVTLISLTGMTLDIVKQYFFPFFPINFNTPSQTWVIFLFFYSFFVCMDKIRVQDFKKNHQFVEVYIIRCIWIMTSTNTTCTLKSLANLTYDVKKKFNLDLLIFILII